MGTEYQITIDSRKKKLILLSKYKSSHHGYE